MGTNLKDIIETKEVDIGYFENKKLAVDSFNILYQFLTTIRQRDGSLLKDSEGNVTSHLTGIFSRTTNFMKHGLKLAFVFDGKPPKLKQEERERRALLKKGAKELYEEAMKRGRIEDMKKYASRTSRLTKDMVDETKELVSALGCPVVQAESEGEAQMAYIVDKENLFAGISEDYDSLLYRIPKLAKNLTISGRRKVGASYVSVKPKVIDFSYNMNMLGIDQDRLIMIAMLVGTDYNPKGVKGIGPKNALKLVKEYGDDPDKLFSKVSWDKDNKTDWQEIFYLFKKMPVKKEYDLRWKEPDIDKIREILIEKHGFSKERIMKQADLIIEKPKSQKGLSEWF
jgi:flap endonuclease-1